MVALIQFRRGKLTSTITARSSSVASGAVGRVMKVRGVLRVELPWIKEEVAASNRATTRNKLLTRA